MSTPDSASAPVAERPATAKGRTAGSIVLPALEPKPHLIIGRAVFEDGRPVPDFIVHAAGYNGKFDAVLNTKEGATSYGSGKGSGGTYEIQVESSHLDPQGKRDPNEDALIFSVRADTTLTFHGHQFGLPLHPVDGVPNGTAKDNFRGQLRAGIVRDFVLKISGIKPGFSPEKYPDHGVSLAGSYSKAAYYGGGLKLRCDSPSGKGTKDISHAYKGASLTLTLTPTSPLVDGSAGQAITRVSAMGSEVYLWGIPYGAYDLHASLTEAGGATRDLRCTLGNPTSPATAWTASVPIEWKPLENAVDRSGTSIGVVEVNVGQ